MIRYIAKIVDKDNPDDIYIWGRRHIHGVPFLVQKVALYKPVLFKSRARAVRAVKKYLFDFERLVIVKYERV